MNKDSDSGKFRNVINLQDIVEVKATRFNDWQNTPKGKEESKLDEAFIESLFFFNLFI